MLIFLRLVSIQSRQEVKSKTPVRGQLKSQNARLIAYNQSKKSLSHNYSDQSVHNLLKLSIHKENVLQTKREKLDYEKSIIHKMVNRSRIPVLISHSPNNHSVDEFLVAKKKDNESPSRLLENATILI